MLSFFSAFNAISPLLPETQAALMRHMQMKELRRGQVWLQEGAVCDKLSFLVKGMAKLYFETDTKELVICFAREDEWIFSAKSFYDQSPSAYSIRAVAPCSVIYINQIDLQFLFTKHPDLNIHFRQMCEQQLKQYETHLALLLLPPKERFERIKTVYPWMTEGSRLTDRMLAGYLGITPNGLSNYRMANKKSGIKDLSIKPHQHRS